MIAATRLKRLSTVASVAAAIVLSFSLSAQAHSWSELNDWLLDWDQRYETAWVEWQLSGEWEHSASLDALHEEYDDMRDRHPGWDGTLNSPPEPSQNLHQEASITEATSQPKTASTPVYETTAGPQRMGNGTSDVEQWRPLVAGHFPPNQVNNALCVIKSESGGNAGVDNLKGSAARGLFQIMTTVWAKELGWKASDFYSPEKNVYAAHYIWSHSGWSPWSYRTRSNCGL